MSVSEMLEELAALRAKATARPWRPGIAGCANIVGFDGDDVRAVASAARDVNRDFIIAAGSFDFAALSAEFSRLQLQNSELTQRLDDRDYRAYVKLTEDHLEKVSDDVHKMPVDMVTAKVVAELVRLRTQCADADLLLGNGWEQVVEVAKGEPGVVTALNIQCTKLAGDVSVLQDELDRLRKVADAANKMLNRTQQKMGDIHFGDCSISLTAVTTTCNCEYGRLRAALAALDAQQSH